MRGERELNAACKAPVSRQRSQPGAMTLEACYACPTGPQGAASGATLCLSGQQSRAVAGNALDLELMTGAERVAEISYLLAVGLLRGRLRAARGTENGLAILLPSSDVCVEPKSGGETHE